MIVQPKYKQMTPVAITLFLRGLDTRREGRGKVILDVLKNLKKADAKSGPDESSGPDDKNRTDRTVRTLPFSFI